MMNFLLACIHLDPIAIVKTGGYLGIGFGSKMDNALFKRTDSRFFKQEYLERTERFYQKYGGHTVMLTRFVPLDSF